MGEISTFVGLDVHKATIAVAIAEGGLREAASFFGTIENTPEALAKLLAKLGRKHKRLSFCYEAGPCGYGVHRQLTKAGHACAVVAPALIPRRAGDRVKTDRRDALSLAQLHRAGELSAIWVPDAAHEAMRDLVRARQTAVHAVRRARQHLSGFLLRHARVYSGKKAWTRSYRVWLASLRFEHPAQQIVLQDYIASVSDAERRRDALGEQIRVLLPEWSMAPVVTALQALRGVALIVAATLVAEVGDLTRFDNPRQLMAHLGLVPSEHSSGGSIRRGAITKTGNSAARRAMTEAAWTYRLPARVGRALLDRNEGLDKPVREIAWKAQVRLCARYRRLVKAGKPSQTVVTAIARELAGFAWAIARHVQPKHAQPQIPT
jgi:transposase